MYKVPGWQNMSVSERIARGTEQWYLDGIRAANIEATQPLRELIQIRIAMGAYGGSEAAGFLAGTKVIFKVGIYRSVRKVLGRGYKAVSEVTTAIKNQEVLQFLQKQVQGNWVKVYEAGVRNGEKIEVHYFRNVETNKVFDVKIKYDHWHQRVFKDL